MRARIASSIRLIPSASLPSFSTTSALGWDRGLIDGEPVADVLGRFAAALRQACLAKRAACRHPDNLEIGPKVPLAGQRMARPVENDAVTLQDQIPGLDGNSIFKAMRLPVEQQLTVMPQSFERVWRYGTVASPPASAALVMMRCMK